MVLAVVLSSVVSVAITVVVVVETAVSLCAAFSSFSGEHPHITVSIKTPARIKPVIFFIPNLLKIESEHLRIKSMWRTGLQAADSENITGKTSRIIRFSVISKRRKYRFPGRYFADDAAVLRVQPVNKSVGSAKNKGAVVP